MSSEVEVHGMFCAISLVRGFSSCCCSSASFIGVSRVLVIEECCIVAEETLTMCRFVLVLRYEILEKCENEE